MKTFKYLVLSTNANPQAKPEDNLGKLLNDLGSKGWRVVGATSTTSDPGKVTVILEMELEDGPTKSSNQPSVR